MHIFILPVKEVNTSQAEDSYQLLGMHNPGPHSQIWKTSKIYFSQWGMKTLELISETWFLFPFVPDVLILSTFRGKKTQASKIWSWTEQPPRKWFPTLEWGSQFYSSSLRPSLLGLRVLPPSRFFSGLAGYWGRVQRNSSEPTRDYVEKLGD